MKLKYNSKEFKVRKKISHTLVMTSYVNIHYSVRLDAWRNLIVITELLLMELREPFHEV